MNSKFVQGLLLSFCLVPGLSAQQAGKHAPSAAHVKANITCLRCHGQETPTTTASSEGCMTCHGDFPAMAESTQGKSPNPHAPAVAKQSTCADCHRQHKPNA